MPSLVVEAVVALQTLFRAPLTPGVPLRGQNIAYDLALVKLGPHTKFGEDWSNGVDFCSGHTHTHTHTHTHRFTFIYKISTNVSPSSLGVFKRMRLCHPPDGSTSPKYKVLCFKPL